MKRPAGLAVILLLTACTTSPTPVRPDALHWTRCPADVEVQFISAHQCGTLTVPLHADNPRSKTTDLLVLKVEPVGHDRGTDMGTSLGHDYGMPIPLGGDIAAGATRFGTTIAALSLRGSATHAEPSLACPETERVHTTGVADTDPTTRTAFTAAVSACLARLRAAGIQPADFGAAATAADLEQLRSALGLEQWSSLGTYGTTSATMITYLAANPGRARLVFLDSPAPPGLDPLTAGVEGLDSALTALDRTKPGLLRAWSEALHTSRQHPLRGTYRGVRVVVDDAKLLRLVRFSLGGDGPGNVAYLPAMITDAAHGKLNLHLAQLAAEDPAYCAGYMPSCVSHFSLGLFLTDLCQHLPRNTAALDNAIAGRPAYQQVFAESPYWDACAAWNVPTAQTPALVAANTPILVLTGEYDSFSRPEWAQAWVRQLGGHAWHVSLPGQTHNVLGSSECASTIRGAWRRDPTRPPNTTCAKATP